jgi:hypothetical protein
VDPTEFSPGWQQRLEQQSPTERRKQIQAGIACIPELPPQMQAAAERLKRRYEQRNG